MNQSKWRVGQRVIVWSPGLRSDYEVTKVGRKWVTAKSLSAPWPREYRFDAETREHEDGYVGRIAIDEADITELLIADGVKAARAWRVRQIEQSIRNGLHQYEKRVDAQPHEVLDMFEAALKAAGWWKE